MRCAHPLYDRRLPLKKFTFSVRDMTLCAMGAGLLSVSAWISIPVFDIAFTMQTCALFLLLEVLGGKRGTICCMVYLLLGNVGLPVFSGFRGGPGVLLGVTGGYIMGFLACCLVYWAMTALLGSAGWVRITAVCLGMVLCYGFGTFWFLIAYTGSSAMSFWAVTAKCVAPYLLPDALKIFLALSIAGRLKPAVNF